MEDYRKALKIRIGLLSLVLLVAAGMSVYGIFRAPASAQASRAFDFQNGLVIGIGAGALGLIMRYRQAMKDEKRLQMFFNAEHDERLKAIRAKAGLPMILVTSFLMLLAGSFIGYFNGTVFYTLLAAALCQLALAAAVKLICRKRM